MTPLDLARLSEATWPPATRHSLAGWTIRDGQGGGKRVSAATAETPEALEWIAQAEAAMAALGQTPLVLIRPADQALDDLLALRGYSVVDPVLAYAAPTAGLCDPPAPPLAGFAHWPPLAIARDLWAEAGIGPARLAVMDRVAGPKAVLLGRSGDRSAGVAFVALDGKLAMLHALEVAPGLRRQGCGRNLLRVAAAWAQARGADTLAVLVTAANTPARALYASLGMEIVGQYHYRQRQARHEA